MLAEGKPDDALQAMRAAAQREDATEKSAVTPGPLAPARELLGDMLLELKQPAAALMEFRRRSRRSPTGSVRCTARRSAARLSGDRATRARCTPSC